MPSFPCHHPTCAAYVPARGDVCPDHRGVTPTAKQQQQRRYDEQVRDPEAKAFYNSARWQRARAAALAECPFCQRCRHAWAEHVHHIVPLARCTHAQQTDPRNLMPLCAPCHRAIEAEARR